jgi:hypothetical protein
MSENCQAVKPTNASLATMAQRKIAVEPLHPVETVSLNGEISEEVKPRFQPIFDTNALEV